MSVKIPGQSRYPDMALQRRLGRGQASRLCPCSSDVDLFGYGETLIGLNAEVGRRVLDLLVPRRSCTAAVASAAIYEGCFGVLSRMARRTTSSWRSVTSERLPDLAEMSGDRSGQLHALQLGR
jgi:hypothetical protein